MSANSVISQFSQGDPEATARQWRLWFAFFLTLLFGPLVMALAWLLKRSRVGWQLYTGLLSVSVLWLAIFVPEVQAAGGPLPVMLGGGLGRLLVILWIATIPLSPLVTVGLHGFDGLVHFLRPKSLQEHLEEQAALLDKKNRQLSRSAETQVQRAPTAQRGSLSLGVFMKGDRFPDWLGIARDRNNWVTMEEKLLSQHMLIIGTTGAGKSVTLTRIVAEVLRATDRDIFVIDGKGDEGLALDLANLIYYARGQPVPIFKLGLPERGSVYHGFLGEAQDIYNRLCALIGVGLAEGDAQYYADINRDLLQLICYAPGGPPRSFEEVRARVNRNWLMNAYRANPFELATIEEMDGKILHGLLVRLRPLVREFASFVGPEGFALEQVNAAIFSLRTQSVGDTSKRLLHFLVEDVKDFVGKRQKRPGLLIIDEFGAFHNENIVDLLTLARSSDLGVILATQDAASLGDERTMRLIMANTRTKLLMATDFPEEVAKLAGTEYQIEPTIQHQDGDPTGLGSARVQHTFRVDMNEIARLQAGEACLIRQRHAAKLKVARVSALGRDKRAVAQFVKAPAAEAISSIVLAEDSHGEIEAPHLDL